MQKDDEVSNDRIKPYQILRASMYDARIQKTIAKTWNLDKINLAEAKLLAKEWKETKKKEIEDEITKSKEVKQVDIQPFKIELDDKSGLSFLMIGSTRSGKSTALNYMLENYFFPKDNKYINILFSNSYQAGVYDEFKKQKNTAGSILYHPKAIKEAYQINKNTNNKYKFNIILDDIVDKKYDKELIRLLTIYRNSRMGCIICSQAVQIMNSIGRSNINYVMLFKMNSDEQIEKVIKTYLQSYFPSKLKMPERIKKYRELTENHCFFLINNLNGTVCRSKISI
jgi:hypothetical protein